MEKFVGHSEGKCIPFDGIRHFARKHDLIATVQYAKKAHERLSRMVYTENVVEELSLYRKLLHNLVYSGMFIVAIALYEYLRVHRPDLPLPDLKPVVPAASVSVSDSEGVHPFGKHTTITISTDGKGNETMLEHTRTGGPLEWVKSGFEVEKDDGVQE